MALILLITVAVLAAIDVVMYISACTAEPLRYVYGL